MSQLKAVAGGDLRNLARARERFLAGEPVEQGVRSLILSSWERCRSLGISPDDDAPYWQDYDAAGRLVRAAQPVLDWLAAEIAGTEAFITLTDGNGTALEHRFGDKFMIRRLGPVQIEPGFNVAERFAGTNGVGMALAERQPCFVVGSEHFSEWGQSDVCMSFPLHDPLSGYIEGVIDFCFPIHGVVPAVDTLIQRATQAIEAQLLEQSSARERALLRAYLEIRNHEYAGRVRQLAESPLGRGDEMLLKEKAAELISRGKWAAMEVPLSHGQVVALVSRPVASPSGAIGVAVEAVIPSDVPGERLAVVSSSERPDSSLQHINPPIADTRSSASTPPAAAAHAMPCPPRTTGQRLVLVGEPEVGKVAVAARRRLELLSDASVRIGTTLDVTRTAQELAEVTVPDFTDVAVIDLADAVLRGEESPEPGTELRRTVVHGVLGDHPFHPVGARIDFVPATPQSRCLASGRPELEADLKAAVGWLAQDPQRAEEILTHNFHSLITVPLSARGVALGVASFYRSQEHGPFADDDCSLAQELAVRAALCIDNARRFTREHAMVLALQRSLLPHGLPEQNAVEAAYRYLPAESRVGGDWFDVIPLSGTRVALVVGDVVGHGLHAAATMGRLRTAIHNFSTLDLAPDELLTQLDKLVSRLDQDESVMAEDNADKSAGIIGATCLYAIYDPTSQTCSLARAGHPPPALAQPDGSVTFPDLPAGPPLGLGGFPFETTDMDIPEGSQLLLYTDGLIDHRHGDIDVGLNRLRRALSHPDRPMEETCQVILDAVPPDHRHDDISLLLARTRALAPGHLARWDVPPDPAAVSDIRAAVTHQLIDWGLDEAVFTTELLLSELVTNAIRYASGPIQVRLLRDRSLICEVSDASSTSPHLRHAASTDEGGRGLFLVAQLAQDWGTRYTGRGKTIWAEQPPPAHALGSVR
ncbi:SpoIIE family protein phosphatase [Streptomyces malaysiensis]|uniref:SpoIIE family protein phosphatase n=1 Tax=Streptomyces malaysiensis TaxID=92644 RepID=UPI002B2D92EC|nr:SpoIIE family protein phosphatase [Streptomyces malaysiensis]